MSKNTILYYEIRKRKTNNNTRGEWGTEHLAGWASELPSRGRRFCFKSPKILDGRQVFLHQAVHLAPLYRPVLSIRV